MFFLFSFAWLVAASFAWVIAILSSNWITFTKPNSTTITIIQRGTFYVCDLIPNNDNYLTTQCVSIIQQGSSTDSNKWLYQFAIACASLAISCAGLSLIAVWLFGIYFQVRKKAKRTVCFLVFLILLVLLILCNSFVVWILIATETVRLGVTLDRSMFGWPMWLAVGATGGYLMTFLSLIFSCCAVCRRKNKMTTNNYHRRDQF